MNRSCLRMKHIRYIGILVFLFSCSSSSNQVNNSNNAKDDFKTLDCEIPFTGYWLSEDYFNSIQKYKSPKKAQEEATGNFIFIPDRTIKPTMMIYGFHEGSEPLMVLKKDEQFQLWGKTYDTLQFVNEIETLSKDRIKIDKNAFVKVNVQTREQVYQILEEILFKGTYTNVKKEIIMFKNNGELTGLGNFAYYRIVDDYMDEGMQVDQIELSEGNKDPESYGFKFKGDTLEIYQLNCLAFDSVSQQCGEVAYGQLLHKMWRKNE